eukprot:10401595-Ditylum_brightwellii.AAC.1
MPGTNNKPVYNGPKVRIPNGSTMHATHEYHFPIKDISDKTKHANLYPDNTSGTLVSIGQLCDDRWRAIFEKD